MSIEPDAFRRIMGSFATGVAVVTTSDVDTGEPYGLTANAVASVSLDPPLLLACIALDADTHDFIRRAGYFAVNILEESQAGLAERFASEIEGGKFEGVPHRRAASGAPLLDGALAWADCRVWAAYPGGDHTIFVGAVLGGGVGDGRPLLYHRGTFGRFAP